MNSPEGGKVEYYSAEAKSALLGAISVVTLYLGIVGIIFGVLAVFFGLKSLLTLKGVMDIDTTKNKRMAFGGIFLGSLGIVAACPFAAAILKSLSEWDFGTYFSMLQDIIKDPIFLK